MILALEVAKVPNICIWHFLTIFKYTSLTVTPISKSMKEDGISRHYTKVDLSEVACKELVMIPIAKVVIVYI